VTRILDFSFLVGREYIIMELQVEWSFHLHLSVKVGMKTPD
jgi:hypothetical protein